MSESGLMNLIYEDEETFKSKPRNKMAGKVIRFPLFFYIFLNDFIVHGTTYTLNIKSIYLK